MAGDLISREDALRVFYNKEPLVQGEHDGMGMLAHALWRHIREAVEAIPPVEAEPVVHAHWICDCEPYHICSNCRHKFSLFDRVPHCPNCGAHMDEEATG